MTMFKITALLMLNYIWMAASAQSPERIKKKLGDKPVYFIDSIKTDQSGLLKQDAEQIAAVTILTGRDAVNVVGDEGKDGILYIETKPFAKKRFWTFFKSKSEEYSNLVPTLESDTTIQYILNENILKDNYEGILASIDDKVFKEIKI